MIQDSSLWKRFLVGLLMGLILFLSASGSNSNVKITFTSSRYGNDEIYIMDVQEISKKWIQRWKAC